VTSPRSSGPRRFPELGRLLRSRREELGLSRQRLAELTGLSYPYVAQLEGGHRTPSAEAAQDLATALEMPHRQLADLLDREKGIGTRAAERTSDFLANPYYAASPRADQLAVGASDVAPDGGDGVLDEALALLGRLPLHRRLDVLARLQARVLGELVEQEVRRATGKP
jgi:transcriptional regulator with XRE-family HTH domain